MFNREAKALQQGMHDALRDAAGGFQQSFVDAPVVVDRTLILIVGHSKQDKLARLASSSAHFANCGQ